MPLARFHPVLLDSLADYNRHMLTRDISAGLTVGMVALPLAMAFGIASGVPPEAGLYTAIIAGFLISLFGGCRVQIGGPAGAFVVIIYGIIAQYGISNLMLATIGSGIILFFMGLFKLGGFIKFIPISIVIGFTNGIAVMIGLQQVKDFLGLTIAKMPADFFEMIKTLYAHISTFNPWAFAIAITSFLIIFFWPKGYSMGGPQWKRWLAHLPGTVVVLVLSTLVVTLFNLPVETIGSKFGGIPQGLPSFELPDFDWQTAKQLYGSMLTLAVLGSIESLLCARVADTMTDDRHDPHNRIEHDRTKNRRGNSVLKVLQADEAADNTGLGYLAERELKHNADWEHNKDGHQQDARQQPDIRLPLMTNKNRIHSITSSFGDDWGTVGALPQTPQGN